MIIINIHLIPAKTGNRITDMGSVMKDFCQLNTDLQRGNTCFSDNDKLNKIIEINKMIRRIKIIKMIRIIKLTKIIKIIEMIKIIETS